MKTVAGRVERGRAALPRLLWLLLLHGPLHLRLELEPRILAEQRPHLGLELFDAVVLLLSRGGGRGAVALLPQLELARTLEVALVGARHRARSGGAAARRGRPRHVVGSGEGMGGWVGRR